MDMNEREMTLEVDKMGPTYHVYYHVYFFNLFNY